MADCQDFYEYNESHSQKIESALSVHRFEKYKQTGFNERRLNFELYLYNARISKSFLFPLHILEITLRNSIDKILSKKFTEDWFKNENFVSLLLPGGKNAINNAISRSKTNCRNKIISNLSFDFWSFLFNHEYDRTLWQSSIKECFPGWVEGPSRAKFKPIIHEINNLRNRIAHHKTIFDLDLSVIHTKIIDAIKWICNDTSKWVRKHSTVYQTMRTRPQNSAQDTCEEKCDKNFVYIKIEDRLTCISNKIVKHYVAIRNGNFYVFNFEDIGKYVLSNLTSDLIDLSEHTVDMLIKSNNTKLCKVYKAEDIYKKCYKSFKKFNVVLKNNNVIGVIVI